MQTKAKSLCAIFTLATAALLITLLPIVSRAASSTVLINAICYDPYLENDPNEAFQLLNVSGDLVTLTNWTVTDFEGTVTLSDTLAAGQSIWIAREADAFYLESGFKPDYEYQPDTNTDVPDLIGNLALHNDGDQLVLRDDGDTLVDAVVYEHGSTADTGWLGTTITPHNYSRNFSGVAGQILYRKLDQATGRPVPDTDTDADWAQDPDDDINGQKVQYLGWDLDRYFFTHQVTQTASITYVVAPDAIYEVVAGYISRATQSIYYEGYTFKNAHLADLISAALTANPGMTVTMLLEGGPAGGLDNQEKRNCQVVENAGGQCWFMINDPEADPKIHNRYKFQHAKFIIIDGKYLLTGSENLNYSSMPADDKLDGTSGNRGVSLVTNSSELISYTLDIFNHDFDYDNHRDLRRWSAGDPIYGAPPITFTTDYSSGGTTYTIIFTTPFSATGEFFFEVVQSPENSLRSSDSLLGMVARAGVNDTVLVEQLYEYKYWGQSNSNPASDPNPRLEAYIEAARRGAAVYLLLDKLFDFDEENRRGNIATCNYVNGIASSEGLNLYCRIGNPTGNGIHNKMVLVQAKGQGWIHTGSINGSENSSKNNRELAIQVKSMAGYNYLAGVFWYDWDLGRVPSSIYLPIVLKNE